MRLLKDVAAGDEITFTYMPLHQDPASWPLERRQEFLLSTYAFTCHCNRCSQDSPQEECILAPTVPSWMPSYHFRWDGAESEAVLIMVVDLSAVWPVSVENLASELTSDAVHLRVAVAPKGAEEPVSCLEAKLPLPFGGCQDSGIAARFIAKRRQLQLRLSVATESLEQ
eukprot:gnl/TRDRNA2_/TRDRNA2_58533_c0_seq1.p1 gnl/TRDRNA2_/TRDRNA2_58533_c0~~gnl/TRDRNA2_/TRDRNA2_58533_c0_seq1.p1  ORF type:complete len:169 (+),score=29.70 gnl/TRDRNA2_/TRDRNA2_58533_c0_seq1:1-507(+)